MFPQPPPEEYYDGFNESLFGAVPGAAKRILEVGCGRGRLGHELKRADPERRVFGVEYEPAAAEVARSRLDRVFEIDIQHEMPPIEKGSLDCVLFGDVLEHLVDPEAVLVATRDLLAGSGIVLLSIPNVGHFSVVRELMRGDFMYQPSGLLDATHLRFFTHATITRLLLDAGFLPSIENVIESPVRDDDLRAARPLLETVGMDPRRARKFLGAFQYIFKGTPLPQTHETESAAPITFAACVNDQQQLQSNLLRSPCLGPGSPHEVILLRDCRSAAEGFEQALRRATHDLVVFVQQDMYLPKGWDLSFRRGFEEAEARFAPLGVVGSFGIRYLDGELEHVGRVVDRDKLLEMPTSLPGEVDGIDEILLGVRRSTPLRFDPTLGFHLYGADICLAARSRGLRSAVVDAPCFHNSLYSYLSAAFHRSRETLLAKWPNVRPLHTNMGRLDTMVEASQPHTWNQEQNQKLLDLKRERDEARRDLRFAQRRVQRMEASPFWKARTLTRRFMPRFGDRRRGDEREATRSDQPGG